MNYTQPEQELREIAERILNAQHDSLAYYQPAVDTFYFVLDAQRIARAYLNRLEPIKYYGVVIEGAID